MSVTAVPLRPIAKGSLTKLWVGVAAVVLASAGLASVGQHNMGTTESGIRYQVLEAGTGESPTKEDFALVAYKGTLDDGTVFDQNERAPMALEGVVPGFAEAITMMKKGGHIRVAIPASLAYGNSPPPGSAIPAGATLHFDIKLLEFKTKAEMQELQRQMMMQQMMGGGAGGAGAPGQMPPAGGQ